MEFAELVRALARQQAGSCRYVRTPQVFRMNGADAYRLLPNERMRCKFEKTEVRSVHLW